MKVRPLIFIPSPRDLPEFNEATSKLKEDKLWLKYWPQAEAYNFARDIFLSKRQYTHLVILPDDLIATQEAIDILKKDATKYKIISGWSNCTAGKTDNVDTQFSLTLPAMQTKEYEPYNFLPIAKALELQKTKGNIIKVMHQGTALSFISRKIVEQLPFSQYAPPDLALSYDLFKMKISQYVDLRARCTHLRRPEILVGKRQPEMKLELVK